jgi:photosynthetic reaction center cytochrome c subunit
MNRAFIHTLFALAITGGLAAGAVKAHGQAPSAGDAQKTAEQAFKNIQVLKGTPADQLQPTMQFIANSLGVECSFCHVQNAFDKDDKKTKLTARKMIEMQAAINKTHFNGDREITCYSCHHGAEHPAGIPIIAEEETPRNEFPLEEPQLPSADQVIDKYIQAMGGADAIQKITSRVQKGTITFGQSTFPAEVVSKAPNKRISTISTPNGENITAYDGHAGWLGSPGGRPPRDMTAQEDEAIAFDATFYLPLELKKMFNQLRVRPAAKIGKSEVYLVIGTNPGKPPVRLFFDKVSGYLLRTVRYVETPLGQNPTQVDYAEYRVDNGVKLPFKWTIARPLGRFTIEISEIHQNVPVDDSKFAKPAATAAPVEPKPAEKPPAK